MIILAWNNYYFRVCQMFFISIILSTFISWNSLEKFSLLSKYYIYISLDAWVLILWVIIFCYNLFCCSHILRFGHWKLFQVDFYVLLIWLHCVLISCITKCSGLILYFPCSWARVSHFSKVLCFLYSILENGTQKPKSQL